MEIALLLAKVVQLLPFVQALVGAIDPLRKSDVPAIVDLVAKIAPNVQHLLEQINDIKSATEDEFPEVWAPIKDDFVSAYDRWFSA